MAQTDPGPPVPPGTPPATDLHPPTTLTTAPPVGIAALVGSDGSLPATVIHPKVIAGAAGGIVGLGAIAAAVATGVLQQCGGYQGVLEAAIPILIATTAAYLKKGPAPV